MRCVYCMPPDGVLLTSPEKLSTFNEKKKIIHTFVNLGIDKIRFTGGEPTVYKSLTELIAYTSSLKVEVCL